MVIFIAFISWIIELPTHLTLPSKSSRSTRNSPFQHFLFLLLSIFAFNGFLFGSILSPFVVHRVTVWLFILNRFYLCLAVVHRVTDLLFTFPFIFHRSFASVHLHRLIKLQIVCYYHHSFIWNFVGEFYHLLRWNFDSVSLSLLVAFTEKNVKRYVDTVKAENWNGIIFRLIEHDICLWNGSSSSSSPSSSSCPSSLLFLNAAVISFCFLRQTIAANWKVILPISVILLAPFDCSFSSSF